MQPQDSTLLPETDDLDGDELSPTEVFACPQESHQVSSGVFPKETSPCTVPLFSPLNHESHFVPPFSGELAQPAPQQSTTAVAAMDATSTEAQLKPADTPQSSESTFVPCAPASSGQQILSAWNEKGIRIFLDLCSGFSAPLSTAIRTLQLPCLAIDPLLDARMDILHDDFYEQLLRLAGSGTVAYSGASPPCKEYSRLKLRPGGPKALRTPEQLSGVDGLTEAETNRLQDSAALLDRCINCLRITFASGGHGHLEQPAGAMSWEEKSVQGWLHQGSCSLVLLAACKFGMNIRKSWLLATSFFPLSMMAAQCDHPPDAHESIAGKRDAHGIYISRHSAVYPEAMAESFAQTISVLLSPKVFHPPGIPYLWTFPRKAFLNHPIVFVMGVGLHRTLTGAHRLPMFQTFFGVFAITGIHCLSKITGLNVLFNISHNSALTLHILWNGFRCFEILWMLYCQSHIYWTGQCEKINHFV